MTGCSRARFFVSENFDGDMEVLKRGLVNTNDLLNLMILGIHQKAPSLEDIFRHNAVGWMGTSTYLVRYEEIIAHLKRLNGPDAEAYFMRLFAACGLDPVPADWRARVLVGSDRRQSSTARENLAGGQADLPDELPEIQKRLIEYAAPGLRPLLGYGQA